MRIIRQRYGHDCGIAVAGMLGNVSYEAVLDRLVPGLAAERGLGLVVMWRTLIDITETPWKLTKLQRPWSKVRDWSPPETPAALVIEHAPRSHHYIAVCSGMIYDPAFDAPFRSTDYPGKGGLGPSGLYAVPNSHTGRRVKADQLVFERVEDFSNRLGHGLVFGDILHFLS